MRKEKVMNNIFVLISAIALIGVTQPVSAGTITFDFGGVQRVITTTASQDVDLTAHLARVNTNRALDNLPALTLEEYFELVCTVSVDKWVTGERETQQKEIASDWSKLSAQDKQAIIDEIANRMP
jgi:hypothetical protein